MGEQIVKTGNELKERWTQRMPRFFRQIVVLCACIMVTAFGINEIMIIGHATPHEWWNDIYPLLLSVPFGMMVVCKLTVAGGYKEIDPNKVMNGNIMLNQDIDHMHGESPIDKEGNVVMEIEPYDDRPNA